MEVSLRSIKVGTDDEVGMVKARGGSVLLISGKELRWSKWFISYLVKENAQKITKIKWVQGEKWTHSNHYYIRICLSEAILYTSRKKKFLATESREPKGLFCDKEINNLIQLTSKKLYFTRSRNPASAWISGSDFSESNFKAISGLVASLWVQFQLISPLYWSCFSLMLLFFVTG